jgi:nucleolar protein 4
MTIEWAVPKNDFESNKEEKEAEEKDEEATIDVEAKEDEAEEEAKEEVVVETDKRQGKLYEDCTLFIRNINFETDDDDLFEYFSQFGEMRYAKVVYQKETGAHRGTAFVCFKSVDDATKVIEMFKTTLGEEYELNGRLPIVSVGVTRDAAEKITKSEEGPKPDKRNLRLAKEGLVRPGSAAYDNLDKEELERRTLATKAKIEKLKNPNVFVS